MTAIVTTEFWVLLQLFTIILLLGLLMYFIRLSKSEPSEEPDIPDSAEKVVELMEPFIKEAESMARQFEHQIQEKRALIRDLNDALDSRIISLNLLLNRADAYLARNPGDTQDLSFSDTQESIIELFDQGISPKDISDKLSVSGQEVDLVISLKKKFLAMEKGSPKVPS